MASINLRNVPYSQTIIMDGDPAADVVFNWFRFPAEGRVLAVYASNDAAIATATNTLMIAVGSRGTAGTNAMTTIASFDAGTTWAADTPRTGTLTAANQDIPSGTWIGITYDETGSGTWTRMAIQIDYALATGETS